MNISFDISGDKELVASFGKVQDGIADLRKFHVWFDVRQAFYKVQKSIFAAEGPGWQALSPAYAAVKSKKWGSKPILQASGKMWKEFTQSAGSVEEGPTEMTLGFSSPAGYHMSKGNRGKMPYRSSLDMTEAQTAEVLAPIGKRLRQLIDNARLSDLQNR